MKSITIFYNFAIDEEIKELLKETEVSEYTIIPRCHGQGNVTGPRMDDHVWPGYNVTIITVLPDALAKKLMTALQELRNGMGTQNGIFAYQTNVEATLTPPSAK